MSSVANPGHDFDADVVIGVDTHEQFHVAAAIHPVTAGILDTITITADPPGYDELIAWARTHGQTVVWGIEGTNSHGIGLTRALTMTDHRVVEVDRPNRSHRRHGIKTDHIDAVRAAREVISRGVIGTPRATDGPRAELEVLVAARRLTIGQATDTERHLRALVLRAPAPLRARFTNTSTAQIVRTAAALPTSTDHDGLTATMITQMRRLATRIQDLRADAKHTEREITKIVTAWRPDLLERPGIGPITAARLLLVWSHPGRIRTEAAFAMIAGTAPIPATSGKQQTRHRLNRSGDRQLNNALHTITLARCRHDPTTQDYIQRRTTEGKTPREIRRCLKRYLARQLFKQLEAGLDRT